MRFYIVRHGQTLFNVQGKIQGWCDSPLTELGIEQAKKRANLLKDIDFVAAYSSTQERAKDTCEILMNGRDIPFTALKNFKEMNFGTYEADKGDFVFSNPEIFNNFDTYFEAFGGERVDQVISRFIEGLKLIASTYTSGNVLVTAHGGCISQVMESIDQKKFQESLNGEFLNNCALCIVEYDGDFKLLEVCNEVL